MKLRGVPGLATLPPAATEVASDDDFDVAQEPRAAKQRSRKRARTRPRRPQDPTGNAS